MVRAAEAGAAAVPRAAVTASEIATRLLVAEVIGACCHAVREVRA
jgi:hypothetical protein